MQFIINFVLNLWGFLIDNWNLITATILAMVGAAELFVRLTPTKKDDTAVEKLGKWVRKFFDVVKVPNRKRGGGVHEKQIDKEKDPAQL